MMVFMERLYGLPSLGIGDDSLRWILASLGSLQVKGILSCSTAQYMGTHAPLKVTFIVWCTTQDKILTADN